MQLKLLLTALLLCLFSTAALAQLEPFTDYDISDELWNITTIKVDPNMGDDYLEGLRDTWVASNKIAMELGQIEDFMIFRSQSWWSSSRTVTASIPTRKNMTNS